MTNPISIICAACGSHNVKRDAWAEWNEETQAWELGTVFDAGHCDDCDGAATLKEVPKHTLYAECQNCDWNGDEEHCKPIQDITERVQPGEPMPCGECPHCGALCQQRHL